MKNNPEPGQVYLVDLGLAAKVRPILILSAHDPDAPLAIATGLSITTRHHGSAYEVALPRVPFLREQSFVNAQSLGGFKWVELLELRGKLDAGTMAKIAAALRRWIPL